MDLLARLGLSFIFSFQKKETWLPYVGKQISDLGIVRCLDAHFRRLLVAKSQ